VANRRPNEYVFETQIQDSPAFIANNILVAELLIGIFLVIPGSERIVAYSEVGTLLQCWTDLAGKMRERK
jgi:hypothetical protein